MLQSKTFSKHLLETFFDILPAAAADRFGSQNVLKSLLIKARFK